MIIKENQYCQIRNQPFALFSISSEGHHIRQTVQSAQFYQWTLDFGVKVKCHFIKKVVMGETNSKCSQMVQSGHQNGIKLTSTATLQSIITRLATTTDLNNGIICSLKADTKNNKFPASQGMLMLIFIKAAPITRRLKGKKPQRIGQKIKIKSMINEREFKDRMIRDKLQSLGQCMTHEIVVKQKIVVGSSWNGRFYFGKREHVKNTRRIIDWQMEEKTSREISEYEYHVEYDSLDKPVASLEDVQRTQAQRENREISSKVSIGITGFENVYTKKTSEYFGASLYALIKTPTNQLRKLFKVEINNAMKRIKIWHLSCFYYYKCTDDKTYLGDYYSKAMKIGGGVRMHNGYDIPVPIFQLETVLLQAGVLKRRSDAIAMNLYEYPSSGIDPHSEDDRYCDVVSCVFTSDPDIKTYLSINQSGIHGTTEVDIESGHLAVWCFDSYVKIYVFFFLLLIMHCKKYLVKEYCMKSPNKHGIDRINLKLPVGGWRLVILFRNLQPIIKKQVEHHRDFCYNDDINEEIMKKCECYKIK